MIRGKRLVTGWLVYNKVNSSDGKKTEHAELCIKSEIAGRNHAG